MGEIRACFDYGPRDCDMEYEIGSDESPSTAVVCAVSTVEGVDYRSLRPLPEVIDPDALDDLFDLRGDGTSRPGGRLTFIYSKCSVTVDNGEYLTIQPIEPGMRDERDPDVAYNGIR